MNEIIYPEELMGLRPMINVREAVKQAAERANVQSTQANQVAQAAQDLTGEALRQGFKQSAMTREQRLLYALVNQFTEETRSRIKQGAAKMKDYTVYIRRNITGASGIIKLFDDTVDRVEGICNISKAKLADGVNMLVTRLEWRFAYDANEVPAADYQDAYSVNNTLSAALVNGEVEVLVGNEVKFRGPGRDLLQIDREYPAGNRFNGMNLKNPFFIPEKTDIQIHLITAQGTSVPPQGPANQTFKVEFALKGIAVAPVR